MKVQLFESQRRELLRSRRPSLIGDEDINNVLFLAFAELKAHMGRQPHLHPGAPEKPNIDRFGDGAGQSEFHKILP